MSADQLDAVAKVKKEVRPAQLLVGSCQSVGMQRNHNEDTLITLSAVVADDMTDLPFGVFIVADGMGGHQYGEVASGTAARAMAEYLISKLYSSLAGVKPEAQGESLQEIMEAGVNEANQAVIRKAPGGGTTLTTALVIGEQVTIAHVGDSRAYFLFTDGRVQALTQDHSLVRRLVQLKQITEEEALVHPQRNVLYRAIGQNEPFRPDINSYLLPHPGYLMICSDGLWGVVNENEISRIVLNAPSLTSACQSLIDAANDAGGPDNITAVLVQYLL
ncbi:PP2C family protein-serine/threonine phosphatase [Levilinea saccharolytica]|uniref:PP2C family protein-serine/threonine phosphatase n=1 Tax=Levilinea saccharolytica TaxID=229921 RepID=UPI0011BDA37F|nr:protein phosphatase 2C domain-containing protein [Levilinea saccharolytica]